MAIKTWTLFLDRDGVINKRLPGQYVSQPAQFEFIPGVLKALVILRPHFKRIVVVTNQQGIGKNLMTREELSIVHDHMKRSFKEAGTYLDAIYYCPYLEKDSPFCRKPQPGMAFEARHMFTEIDFDRSIMVGDSLSDFLFGTYLNMKTVRIIDESQDWRSFTPDYSFDSLLKFAKFIDQIGMEIFT